MAAEIGEGDFGLVRSGTPSLYYRAIGVIAAALFGCLDALRADRDQLARKLRADLRAFFSARQVPRAAADKPLMQALTLTMSALAALDRLADDPLEDLVRPVISRDVEADVRALGALQGRPQSGNLAMFLAIVLVHAQKFFGMDTTAALGTWVQLHLSHMNRFGFWSRRDGMTHLQFQNGYHQYEIFEFLRVRNAKLPAARQAVASLADSRGHFAPYPGGGGCFDYYAVFVLTAGGGTPSAETRALLERTAASILDAQGSDGGFCESRHVRPRSLENAARFGRQVASAWRRPALFGERLRYGLTLQRRKHDQIHTHWGHDPRGWDESNLWDTYFRMLALARIDAALNGDRARSWGFLSYPGIGHHVEWMAHGR
jgi:hypothetical protein